MQLQQFQFFVSCIVLLYIWLTVFLDNDYEKYVRNKINIHF